MNNKPIGLIGGMGPFASAYFYKLLLEKAVRDYGAKNNNDYPEIVIDSVPVTDFISDTSSLNEVRTILKDRIKKLNNLGCNPIAMICNTGHILYPDLKTASGGRFVSMIELVADQAKKLKLKRVGLIATKTTIETNLYKKLLQSKKIELINADENMQMVHEIIIRQLVAGKKSESQTELLSDMAKRFISKEKLDGIILGCTELPLVFPKNKFKNVIDPTEALANELLFRYYSRKGKI